MRKFYLLFLLSISTTYIYAQSGQKWSVGGNGISNGDFLGTTNNQSLSLRTNNIERFKIDASGNYFFNGLSGSTIALLSLNSNGQASRFNFTGNATDVLLGNGTFGSYSSISGWSLTANTLFTPHNIAIDAPHVQGYKMTINGNVLVGGKISATELEVVELIFADTIKGGQSLKIRESLCFHGYNSNDPNSRNEICGKGNDLYIMSENNGYHTIFNYGNTGNVGIGTNTPQAKFHVTGSTILNGGLQLPSLPQLNGTHVLLTDLNGNVSRSSFSTLLNEFYSVGCLQDLNGNNLTTSIWHYQTGLVTTGLGTGPCDQITRVGINTQTPNSELDVVGNATITGTLKIGTSSIWIGGTDQSTGSNNTIFSTDHFYLQSDAGNSFNTIINGNNTGNVGIGLLSPAYKLDVAGTIRACRIMVEANGWCDYVFEKNYSLRSIDDLEKYIFTNKHLPNFPSEKTITENQDYDLAEMDKNLLKTAEENSLYIIQLKKENDILKAEMELLKKQMQELLELIKN